MEPENSNPTSVDDTKKNVENQPENPSQETAEQINWRKFRETREAERKAKEEAEKRAAAKESEAAALKAAMEALVNKPNNTAQLSRNTAQSSYEYNEEETEDERIQRKVLEVIEVRDKQLEAQRRQQEAAEFPQRLVRDFKDFHQICNEANLDYLEFHHPEIAFPYKKLEDGYEKWSGLYKSIKKYVNNANSKKDETKAQKNFAKPQSISVPGATPTGDTAPTYLDDARRNANWSRMQRVMKGG